MDLREAASKLTCVGQSEESSSHKIHKMFGGRSASVKFEEKMPCGIPCRHLQKIPSSVLKNMINMLTCISLTLYAAADFLHAEYL